MAKPLISYRRIDQLKARAFDCGFSNEDAKQFGKVEFVEPLTEYPATDNEKEGTSKCFGHALNLLNTCTHQKTAAFNST
jgi:hypothetical protein